MRVETINLIQFFAATNLIIGTAAKLTLLSANVTHNPTYLQDFRMIIKPGNDSLDIFLSVIDNLNQDPWIMLSLSTRNRRTKRYRTLFEFDNNVCPILNQKLPGFQTTWLHDFFKDGNLPQRCPFTKGNYSYIDLKPAKVSIPQLFPGTHKVVAQMYFRKTAAREFLANASILLEWN